jgi:hypothetical protein
MHIPGERDVVVVDMDGTIADATRREREFLTGDKKDWRGFFRDMENDPVIPGVLDEVRRLSEKYDVVILTGRPEKYRRPSQRWLKARQVPHKVLLMRRHGDSRPDYEAKADVLAELQRTIKPRKVLLALDDRGPVCDAYRAKGVHCVHIEGGWENEMVNETYRLMAE